MKFEVEFRPVGDGSRAGDCILVRYGSLELYYVMVVDGGTRDSGANLVDHIRSLCGTSDVKIADVVVTHADQDHASGIRDVLENLKVFNLWMHVPWRHAAAALPYFKDKRLTSTSLSQRLRKEYDILTELSDLAEAKDIQVQEPFMGSKIGPFTVLSPSEFSYVRLLPQFSRTPDAADDSKLLSEGYLLEKPKSLSMLGTLVEKAKSWVDEKWNIELLHDGGSTTASNESSAVLYGDFDDHGSVLLTADAGYNGLTWASDYAESVGIDLKTLQLAQVPHHGSRSNVGPSILNRILGPSRSADQRSTIAFISAPKDDETHPRKMVVNAFLRRCAGVYATQGNNLVHRRGFKRDGLVNATPLPFYNRVEAYD